MKSVANNIELMYGGVRITETTHCLLKQKPSPVTCGDSAAPYESGPSLMSAPSSAGHDTAQNTGSQDDQDSQAERALLDMCICFPAK